MNMNQIIQQQENQLTCCRNDENRREVLIQQINNPISPQPQNGTRHQLKQKTKEQLISIIEEKDRRINSITQQLQDMQISTKEKTVQAQLLRQKVAQLEDILSDKQKKLSLEKQKLALIKQINQRVYGENLQLQKNINQANQEITELRAQFKVQQSNYAIKLAEVKLQFNQEHRKCKEYVKEISVLKAIIKELEEDLAEQDADEDGDCGDCHCPQTSTQTKDSDFDEIKNQQSIDFMSRKSHENNAYKALPDSHKLNRRKVDDKIQQSDIIFSSA